LLAYIHCADSTSKDSFMRFFLANAKDHPAVTESGEATLNQGANNESDSPQNGDGLGASSCSPLPFSQATDASKPPLIKSLKTPADAG